MYLSSTGFCECTHVTPYSRHDVLRILHIHPRQLGAWERAGLISPKAAYTFQDLVQLRKLRDLRATRLSVASIRASVSAMRAVSGMTNPLLEAGTARDGHRLSFRHSGALMEPIARQFVLDFEADASAPCGYPLKEAEAAQPDRHLPARIQSMFTEAVRAEESTRTAEAIGLYTQILALDAHHAPSCINLGTILYNQRQYQRAEQFYRRATETDPSYALAWFDLGNVLDELQRLSEAIDAYSAAIRLVPGYADAHYNLALAFERRNERRKALRHWTAYLKLDPIGHWASHARSQRRRILDRETLTIVHRSPNASMPVRPPKRPLLA